ncbi:tetratricopeptide repeat protein [Desulfovulcanus sp.]
MQDKINFYEEVLALDPHSKLFFPLARLYLENKQIKKAQEVLKAGLEKHPEHLEAKLFLAKIYFLQGQEEEGEKICAEIFELLKDNSFFWTSLERFWAKKGQVDLALAFKFIAGYAQGQEFTWSQILKAGLLALEKSPEVGIKAPLEEGKEKNMAVMETLPSEQINVQEWASRPVKESSVEFGQLSGQETSGDKQVGMSHDEEAPDQTETASETGALVDADKVIDEEFDEVEEVKDLNFEQEARTRSLADLLFEQEEYAKALDIYEELWRASLPGSERKELENRIKEIKNLLAGEENRPEQKMAAESDSNEEAIPEEDIGQDEVVDFLSSLAERLEARAESLG